MIKTARELAQAAFDVARNYKTLYVMGCFGAPMTQSNKNRYINSYSFNRKDERKPKIQAASVDTFGFDCVCFIKGLLWGWKGDASQVYGGAQYKANGVPDMGADQMIAVCKDVSTDFSNIQVGEAVWLPGHIGIYVGDGAAVEATYADKDGVQIQAVLPMGQIPGMPSTNWLKHGKLPWVSYEKEPVVQDTTVYRVVIEGLPKDKAENLAQMYKDEGIRVSVSAISVPEPTPEPAPEPAPAPAEPKWEPEEGDIVQFKGGMQYNSSNATTGSKAAAGQATITKIVLGKKHPYHLKRTGKTGPYGWVDLDTFKKIKE